MEHSMEHESEKTQRFQKWLQDNNAYTHPSIFFDQGEYGSSVFTSTMLNENTTIVSCPFDLIITSKVAKDALQSLTGNPCRLDDREALCTYLVLHSAKCRERISKFISPELITNNLRHQAYIDTLPTDLLTPLFYTDEEFNLLRGTNLYAATIERKAQWEAGWRMALDSVRALQLTEDELKWEDYLRAQTWISSRAFPSSLMEDPPSLTSTTAFPVLVPLVDALNHARGTPILWSIDQSNGAPTRTSKRLSLVSQGRIGPKAEIYNNYGAKPNSELLLGYGFTLPSNPDDTLLLKLPGSETRFEIGRGAQGEAQGVWDEVGRRLEGVPMEEEDEDEDVRNAEMQLEIGQVLLDMLRALQARLPTSTIQASPPLPGVRNAVQRMTHDYIEGQREILDDLLAFTDGHLKSAIKRAQELGIDMDLASEDED